MPTNLKRHDELGNVHFLTVSCCRRLPFFASASARDVVTHCMDRCRQRIGFRWIGYVIMPEHVHWLIYPQHRSRDETQTAIVSQGAPNRLEAEPTAMLRAQRDEALLIPISTVLLVLKTSIGRTMKQHLRTVWADQRTLGDRRLDEWARSSQGVKPIWTTRGIDFNVRSFNKLKQKLDYCHANPVKRGLVDTAEAWRWSSYRFYEMEDDSVLRMDWDGVWPLH